MKFETGTIPQTLQHLKDDGILISENALRTWVKNGSIPANYCGNRAYLWYPNVLAFLMAGSPQADAVPVMNGIRKIG